MLTVKADNSRQNALKIGLRSTYQQPYEYRIP
jgi:hypothetical protein